MPAPAQANALLEQALQAHRAGRIEQAIPLYRATLAVDPRNAVALSTLGMVYLQRGDAEHARPLLETASAVQPDSADTWMALGNLHARTGAFEQAGHAFANVVRLRPDVAAAHVNHGNALRRGGRLKEAIAAFRRGIALDPRLALAHYNLGIALTESGGLEAAGEAFQSALDLDPGLLAARMNLGNLFLRQDRAEAALSCFDAVLSADPAYPKASYNRGVALLSLDRCAEATAAFELAIARNERDAEAHNNLVISLLREQRPQAALAACERFLASAPATPKMLAYKAAALIELDRRDDAAALLDFDRLLAHRQLPAPDGFASVAAMNSALAAQVAGHETLVFEPADKSTRGGSQTGEFLDGLGGAAAALRGLIVAAVRDYIGDMRTRLPHHPFVAGLPDRWQLASWAVSLQAQGHQGPHFHPDGCVSGVYYVRVPDSVLSASNGEGCLEFGRTADAIGGGSRDPLLRLVTPAEGLLLLFPSYFYHRTLPFDGPQSRISIAFDVLPA